jgi:hypothetical protein
LFGSKYINRQAAYCQNEYYRFVHVLPDLAYIPGDPLVASAA